MEWHIVTAGRVWVAPGGAFGLVPQALWEERHPTNEEGNVPMDLNCLLVRSQGKTILVDTGLGDKLTAKAQRNWGLEYPQGGLVENLAKLGVAPEEVDIVINTHLHSDHCGGNTVRVGEKVVPAFPNAEYWVQRMEWADAMHPNPRTRATYLAENFEPVWTAGQYRFLNGDQAVTEEARCVLTRGHTRGHQSVILEGGGNSVLFLGDLASFAILMERTSWVTAYDVEPLETIATKQRWQAWALEQEAELIFEHDTARAVGRLVRNEEGRLGVEGMG